MLFSHPDYPARHHLALRHPPGDPRLHRKPGSVSGRIYAISTLGSFVGTFLPVPAAHPADRHHAGPSWSSAASCLASALAILGFGHCLRLAGGPGRYPGCRSCCLSWLRADCATARSSPRRARCTKVESAYNYIQVLEVDGYRMSTPERRPGPALDLASHQAGLLWPLGAVPGGAFLQPGALRTGAGGEHGDRRPGSRHCRPSGDRSLLALSPSMATRSTRKSSRSAGNTST